MRISRPSMYLCSSTAAAINAATSCNAAYCPFDLFDRQNGVLGRRMRVQDLVPDLLGCFRGVRGKRLYFLRDYCDSLACLARPCRFDRRVECKEVGLFSCRGDEFRDVPMRSAAVTAAQFGNRSSGRSCSTSCTCWPISFTTPVNCSEGQATECTLREESCEAPATVVDRLCVHSAVAVSDKAADSSSAAADSRCQ